MKVLLVNRFFGGSQVPTGRMLLDVARELRQSGHEVEVLASSGQYGDAGCEDETLEGFCIHRLPMTGFRSRILAWLSFCLQAWLVIPRLDFDCAVLLTDPPFLLPAAWRVNRADRRQGAKRRRILWWTMDLYPEAMVAAKMLRAGGIAHRALSWLNELGIRSLDGVICLGDQQHLLLRKYRALVDQPVELVPPWDDRPIAPVPRSENRVLDELGVRNHRVALYAGNLGQAHTYRDILRAARHLQEAGHDDWRFVFVCRGAGRDGLEKESADLANVIVRDYVSADKTPDLLYSADVHLITLNPTWNGIVVPSKLYGVLQTSAPVLFIGPENADTAAEIRRLNAGRVLPHGCDAETIANSLGNMTGTRNFREQTHLAAGPSEVAAIITEQRGNENNAPWAREAA